MGKQEVIDGTARDLVVYDVPTVDLPGVEITFSDNLEAEEEDIASIQVTTDILGLIQGVKIARIEREGLWRQGPWDNLRAYRVDQFARLGIPKSTLSTRRAWGEAWIDHNKFARKLPLQGNISKLGFLDDALRLYEQREVFAHWKADSYRDFVAWVRPSLPGPGDLPDVELSIDGDEIALDGTPMLAFDEDLDAAERDFIAAGLRALYRARRGNCIAHVVPCYTEAEARWVEKALKDHRAEK